MIVANFFFLFPFLSPNSTERYLVQYIFRGSASGTAISVDSNHRVFPPASCPFVLAYMNICVVLFRTALG